MTLVNSSKELGIRECVNVICHRNPSVDMLAFKSKNLPGLIRTLAVLSFVLFGLNSISSIIGYSHDQHFQIIEFANFKKGGITAEELAWEYRYRERQAIQPALVYLLLSACDSLKIFDPIAQTQILRLLTSIFMLICLARFVHATVHYFKEEFVGIYVFSSFLVWFIPCYYVHFASETFSQALMLLGCACLFRRVRYDRHLFFAGLIFGLAFFARFQSAVTMLIILWGFYIVAKISVRDCSLIFLGGAAGLAAGIAADTWFYGEPVLTPYRYFVFQLTKGVVNAFGTSPFHTYWVTLFWYSTPVFGVLFYLAFWGNLVARKKSVLFASVIGTILFLSFIGHKEPRFLLQVAAFFPFVVVFGLQALKERSLFFVPANLSRPIISGLIVLNFGIFFLRTLQNNGIMSTGPHALAPVITRGYYHSKVELFYTSEYWHPFRTQAFNPEPAPGQGHFGDEYLHRRFYQPREYSERKITGLGDTILYEISPGVVNLVYVNKAGALSDGGLDKLYTSGYILRHSSVPHWLDKRLPQTGVIGAKLSSKITYLFEKSSP